MFTTQTWMRGKPSSWLRSTPLSNGGRDMLLTDPGLLLVFTATAVLCTSDSWKSAPTCNADVLW